MRSLIVSALVLAPMLSMAADHAACARATELSNQARSRAADSHDAYEAALLNYEKELESQKAVVTAEQQALADAASRDISAAWQKVGKGLSRAEAEALVAAIQKAYLEQAAELGDAFGAEAYTKVLAAHSSTLAKYVTAEQLYKEAVEACRP